MLGKNRIGAILLMSGEGARFGSSVPKQFQPLAGKKIFMHTLEVFLKAEWIDEIILVCHLDWIHKVQEIVGSKASVVAGGQTRQASSYLGLKGFIKPPEIVIIHDAVRPFVSQKILRDNAEGAIQWGAVDTCIPSNDTLVHAPGGRCISSIPLREELFRGQTPQSFRYNLIIKAHEQTKWVNASDDCRLVLEMGAKVGVVTGDEHNLKITTELDLFLAEQLLRLNMQVPLPQTGSIKDKRFAVLGGLGGIGSAVCRLLEAEGAIAIPLSRQTGVDLTRPRLIIQAFKRLGSIHGLINCAGALLVKPLEELSLKDIQQLVHINFTGLVIACQQAKILEGGHIINIASSAYTRGRKHYSIYSAAKAAVVNFTQALSEEKPHLRVHAVIPQRTNTAMRTSNFPEEDVSSLLDPQDVAKTIVNLLKDSLNTNSLVEVKKKACPV
jgi:4-diphosphocytidyl-2-methyl-D-erithritol synthase